MTAIMQYWVNGCHRFFIRYARAGNFPFFALWISFLLLVFSIFRYSSIVTVTRFNYTPLATLWTNSSISYISGIHQNTHLFSALTRFFFNMILLNSWSKIVHTKIWYRFRHSEALTLETSEHYLFTVEIWPFKNLCDTQFCVSLSHRQAQKILQKLNLLLIKIVLFREALSIDPSKSRV